MQPTGIANGSAPGEISDLGNRPDARDWAADPQDQQDPTIGRAEALRRAEMAMLDPDSPPEFAHPMMWARFVLAGEGGAGR